jgi:hypothetical protein
MILAAVAKKRQWSERSCRYMSLLTIVPGSLIFFATGGNLRAFNVVLSQAVCIGALVGKFAFPNAAENGPFESETHQALLPK